MRLVCTYNRPVWRNPKTISQNSELGSLRSLGNAVNLNCKANEIENVVCEALFSLRTQTYFRLSLVSACPSRLQGKSPGNEVAGPLHSSAVGTENRRNFNLRRAKIKQCEIL